MANWAELYRGLQILETPRPRVAPPSDADLDQFERDFGFRLPLDYRAFIKVFGPGELTYDYGFRSAGCRASHTGPAAEQYNAKVDLIALNAVLQEMMATREAMDGPYTTQARRLVYFAGNTAGDYVGWDPDNICDEKTAEYGVFMVRREDGDARPVANSFAAFVKRECLDDAARPDYWAFQPAWQFFEPAE